MRNLELYIDSSLKEFKLYSYAERILREGSTFEDDSLSVDESISLSLFKEFVDLASLLDSFENWEDSDWSNFLTQMMLAFREKGKADSINCALAALGIETYGTVQIENIESPLSTKITVNIKDISTPNVDTFLERLEQVIPKLLWTHTPDLSESRVSTVSVRIRLVSSYEQTMFDKVSRYSLVDEAHVYDSINWGV